MEINKTTTSQIEMYSRLRADQTSTRATAPHAAQTQGTDAARMDTVSVSDEAILRTEAYRAAMSAPDIRQDKVDDLKERISNGAYQINSRQIAAGMLGMERAMLTR